MTEIEDTWKGFVEVYRAGHADIFAYAKAMGEMNEEPESRRRFYRMASAVVLYCAENKVRAIDLVGTDGDIPPVPDFLLTTTHGGNE